MSKKKSYPNNLKSVFSEYIIPLFAKGYVQLITKKFDDFVFVFAYKLFRIYHNNVKKGGHFLTSLRQYSNKLWLPKSPNRSVVNSQLSFNGVVCNHSRCGIYNIEMRRCNFWQNHRFIGICKNQNSGCGIC